MQRAHGAAIVLPLGILLTGCSSVRVPVATPEEVRTLPIVTAQCQDFQRVACTQHDPMGCWAACAEMVHRYFGRDMSQEQIIERINGASDPDNPSSLDAASYHQVLLALDPEYSDALAQFVAAVRDNGIPGSIGVHFNPVQFTIARLKPFAVVGYDAIISLRAGEPLIALLRADRTSSLGHAYVIYGAQYVECDTPVQDYVAENVSATKYIMDKTSGHYHFVSVDLIDPYTGDSETMDASVFKDRLDFMISRESARQALDEEHDAFAIQTN